MPWLGFLSVLCSLFLFMQDSVNSQGNSQEVSEELAEEGVLLLPEIIGSYISHPLQGSFFLITGAVSWTCSLVLLQRLLLVMKPLWLVFAMFLIAAPQTALLSFMLTQMQAFSWPTFSSSLVMALSFSVFGGVISGGITAWALRGGHSKMVQIATCSHPIFTVYISSIFLGKLSLDYNFFACTLMILGFFLSGPAQLSSPEKRTMGPMDERETESLLRKTSQ